MPETPPSPEPMPRVSTSPHIHTGANVPRIMLDVLIALVPAFAAACFLFGWDAVRLTGACVLACVVSEYVARRAMGRDAGIGDWSAVVTGVLLAFNLPPYLPTWMAVCGSVFAIVIAKQLFGGLGYNPFNPALMGRIFLLVSFTTPMTTLWSKWAIPAPAAGVEAVTSATPLGLLKTAVGNVGALPYTFDGQTAWQFFLGLKNGSIGEVSGLALLIGALWLLYRRCISLHVPATFLASVAAFACVLWLADPARNPPPHFHLLTGGVILGAFFMATDMVTTPVTRSGLLIFGTGCGLITMLIRAWGGYPEGVSFAIVLMNAFTPLINRLTRPRVFGRGARRPA